MKWTILLVFFTAYMAVVSCRGFSRRTGRCESSTDCTADECCVAGNNLQLVTIGRCRRLSSFGRRCTPEDQAVEVYGGKYVQNCPCASGLSCENVGRNRGRQSILRNRLSQRCVRGTTSSTSTASTPTTTSAATTPTSTPATTTPATTPATTTSATTPATTENPTTTVNPQE